MDGRIERTVRLLARRARHRYGTPECEILGNWIGWLITRYFWHRSWCPASPLVVRYVVEVCGISESDVRRQRHYWDRDVREVQLHNWRTLTIDGRELHAWNRRR